MLIERYIAKEILQSLAAVVCVLLLIYVGGFFIRYLAWAAEGYIPSSIIFKMLFLQTIAGFYMILPLGYYLAVLLAFGRLYKDSEITALAAAGVSLRLIIKSVLNVSLTVTVVSAILSMYVVPWAYNMQEQIQQQAKSIPLIDIVAAGKFNEVSSPSYSVFYARKVSDDGKRLIDVFAQSRRTDGIMQIITAKEAVQRIDQKTGVRYLELRDGYQYTGSPGEADFSVIQYRESGIKITPQRVQPHELRVRALPTSKIWQSDKAVDKAELQWRLSLPISIIILSLLAVLLSRTTPRKGQFAKLLIAIIVFVAYNNGLGLAKSWVEQAGILSIVGVWGIHGFALLIAYLLYQQQNRCS